MTSIVKTKWTQIKQALCSNAFWHGFFSIFSWQPHRITRRELPEEPVLSETDFRAVEQYLWSAMNEFEKQYGDKTKTHTTDVPSSEEVLQRFAELVKEYDKAIIPCTCVNCKTKGHISRFRSKDGLVRCKCGGICVPMRKGDGIHD